MSWASVAKKALGEGTVIAKTTQPRVVRSEQQERDALAARDATERSKLVGISLPDLRDRFGDVRDFYVFSDAWDWPTLEFRDFADTLENLIDKGAWNEWTWWHGYAPHAGLVVQLKYRNHMLSAFVHRDPGWLYKNNVAVSLREAEIDLPPELVKE